MKKLFESLYILHKCYLNTKLAWEAIDTHQQKGPLFARYHFTQNLSHYIMLEAISFLDEYNSNFTELKVEKEYHERLRIVKLVCRPIIRQINKWKDLKRFRNNIIAHPWRENGNLIVDMDENYIVPRSWIEIRFLKDLINYVHSIIVEEFSIEFNYSMYYGDALKRNLDPIMDMDTINNSVLSILSQSQELMNKNKRDYNVTFYTYSP